MSAVSGSETDKALVAPGVKPPLAVPRRLLRMRSDAALAERFAAGDEAAFDVIYERHRPVVLAVCMGVLGTPPDAEDATQETFSALAVALRTRPPAELRPWLIRVARNASIDTTRRRRHRLLTLDGEIPEIPARPHGSGQAELAVVLDGIRELPEGQRMALLMRELGGHSYSEIAEFLATDEEAVKGLIARARVGLRTYREATELSCATARSTIAAEPDGRRYDKTIRRHLRGCAACRGYRDALRDDAKALRAALPIQAGAVATGSLSGGMLTAAKGSLISYGLTQAATTCAASACAVGAIGGMVFVAPVHQLHELLPNFVPAKTAPTHHAVKAHAERHLAATERTIVTVSHPAAPSHVPDETTEKPAVSHTAAVHHHRRRHVTFVSLPALHRHHHHRATASVTGQSPSPAQPATQNPAPGQNAANRDNQGDQGQGNGRWSNADSQPGRTQATPPTVEHGRGHGDHGSASQAPQTNSAAQNSPAGSAQSGPNNGDSHGNAGWKDNGNSQGNGNGHHGGRWSTIATTGSSASAMVASAPGSAAASPATATTAAPVTTTTSPSPTPGWSHGRGGGPRHGAGWPQGTDQSSTSTPSTPASTTPAPTTSMTTAGNTWSGSHGGGHGHGGWGQQSSSSPQSASPQSGSSPQNGSSAPSGWGPQNNSGSQSDSSSQNGNSSPWGQ